MLFVFEEITEDLAYRLSSHLLSHDQKASSGSLDTTRPSRSSASPLSSTTSQQLLLPSYLPQGSRTLDESYEASEEILKENERAHACVSREKKEEKDCEGADSEGEAEDRRREIQGREGVTTRQKRERRKIDGSEEDEEEREELSQDPFLLLLNSPGGSLSAGLALVDVLQVSESSSLSIPLYIHRR